MTKKKKPAPKKTRTPISFAQKDFIKNNMDALSYRELSEKTNLTEGVVNNIITSIRKSNQENKILESKTDNKVSPKVTKPIKTNEKTPNVVPIVPKIDNSQNMGRRIKNEQVIATVMTSNAAEVGDEVGKQARKIKLSDKMKSCIHKPKG